MVIVDKMGATPQSGTLVGKYDSVVDALEDLEKVRGLGYKLIKKSPDGIKPVYDGVNPTLSEPTHSRHREGAGEMPRSETTPSVTEGEQSKVSFDKVSQNTEVINSVKRTKAEASPKTSATSPATRRTVSATPLATCLTC